ncbi:MAG: hypothetical protein ACK5T0_05720 [Vampirovibrionales bacterium]|jgi:hypothetical protein
MKIALTLAFTVLTLLASSSISQAATGIDEVTSLRSKLRATIEHMDLDEATEATQSHWLLINNVPWKWDESALSFSGTFVNTNYSKLHPKDDNKNVINFDF